MSESYIRYRQERNREIGLLPPQDEGFFGEMAKGAGHSFYTIFQLDLHNHRNWERPDHMEWDSAVGRYIGEFWFFSLPILILLLWLSIRKTIQKHKIYKELKTESRVMALAELQNGNLDKDTWAKALIAAKGDKQAAEAMYLKLRKL